jgi:hypothetical protein
MAGLRACISSSPHSRAAWAADPTNHRFRGRGAATTEHTFVDYLKSRVARVRNLHEQPARSVGGLTLSKDFK